MAVRLEESWLNLLNDQFEQPYFKQIKETLVKEKAAGQVIYPPGSKIFAALDNCPVDKVKAVIIGQDPYHNPGQAHGLCFSVPIGIQPPPSLINIFQELHDDLGINPPPHGNLESWAHQGILLLNASLTVRAHQAASHAGIGWQQFTDTIIQRLSQTRENLVFLLWGSFAIKKQELVAKGRGHLILTAPHPSPLSAYRGFFGCKHFSKANAYLQSKGLEPIDWKVE
ncbi:MAG: uracil-DNA glycosylase [Fibrobacter sp.]|nr:uracil-DNA glycosylase [Fibrobacter sp.]